MTDLTSSARILASSARILALLDESPRTLADLLGLLDRSIGSGAAEALLDLLDTGEVVEVEEQRWDGEIVTVLQSAEQRMYERGE